MATFMGLEHPRLLMKSEEFDLGTCSTVMLNYIDFKIDYPLMYGEKKTIIVLLILVLLLRATVPCKSI